MFAHRLADGSLLYVFSGCQGDRTVDGQLVPQTPCPDLSEESQALRVERCSYQTNAEQQSQLVHQGGHTG